MSAGVDTDGDGTLSAAEVTEQVTVHVLDMTVKTITDNVACDDLAKTAQRTDGAFVPLDNGEDDYDQTPDYEQIGAVVGADHLLPIVLHQVTGADPGAYLLDIPANIKVWRNGTNRTDSIDNGTAISAAGDTTLYVEGVQLQNGSSVISLTGLDGCFDAQNGSSVDKEKGMRERRLRT